MRIEMGSFAVCAKVTASFTLSSNFRRLKHFVSGSSSDCSMALATSTSSDRARARRFRSLRNCSPTKERMKYAKAKMLKGAMTIMYGTNCERRMTRKSPLRIAMRGITTVGRRKARQ